MVRKTSRSSPPASTPAARANATKATKAAKATNPAQAGHERGDGVDKAAPSRQLVEQSRPDATTRASGKGAVHTLLRMAAAAVADDGKIDVREMKQLAAAAKVFTDGHGRLKPALQRALSSVEEKYRSVFTRAASAAFQTLVAEVGGTMSGPIKLPTDKTPYWFRIPLALQNHRSAPTLPKIADVVIIGAGLTGASAAYHLAEAAKRGLTVVVLEHGPTPGFGASGRNGGNFELMPENFFGDYQGLQTERYQFMKANHPDVDDAILRKEGDRQATLILQFAQRNLKRFKGIVEGEGIQCDFSPHGWLRIADSPGEETGIASEVKFAQDLGINVELWSAARIRKEYDIPAKFAGRLAPDNGNYHPMKFVNGELGKALEAGVQLFTNTSVGSIQSESNDRHVLETSMGTIEARKVIVATNAFTSRLFPELKEIEYYQSQILNLEHAQNNAKGATITEKKGDLYYNFPQGGQYVDDEGVSRGTINVGGGLDRPGKDPDHLRRSSQVLDLVKEQTDERFPATVGQPPSRVWTGPMAFTPDRLPCMGFLDRPGKSDRGVVIVAGFNGYGGSYCTEAGAVAAEMVLTGKTPAHVPADAFSPNRFAHKPAGTPAFVRAHTTASDDT